MGLDFDRVDDQFLAAFDGKTGDVRWQTKRSGEMDPKPEFQKAYGTPLILESGGKSVLVSPAANWVYGYDPETGREIWKAHYGKLGFSMSGGSGGGHFGVPVHRPIHRHGGCGPLPPNSYYGGHRSPGYYGG